MSINPEKRTRVSVSPTGSQTVFTFDFPYDDPTAVKLQEKSAAGAISDKTYGIDYTSSPSGQNDAGGTVTTLYTPAAGTTLYIYLDSAFDQLLKLPPVVAPPSVALEDGLDIQTVYSLQIKEILNRCLKLPVSDPIPAVSEIANELTRKGKILGFDATTGALALFSTVASVPTVVTVFTDTIVTSMIGLDTDTMTDGQTIFVSGRNATGDGRGGLFYLKKGSGATADNGTIYEATGNPANHFFRYMENPGEYNLYWWDVDLDGTDSSGNDAAITQALATIDGKTTYIPRVNSAGTQSNLLINTGIHFTKPGSRLLSSGAEWNADTGGGAVITADSDGTFTPTTNTSIIEFSNDATPKSMRGVGMEMITVYGTSVVSGASPAVVPAHGITVRGLHDASAFHRVMVHRIHNDYSAWNLDGSVGASTDPDAPRKLGQSAKLTDIYGSHMSRRSSTVGKNVPTFRGYRLQEMEISGKMWGGLNGDTNDVRTILGDLMAAQHDCWKFESCKGVTLHDFSAATSAYAGVRITHANTPGNSNGVQLVNGTYENVNRPVVTESLVQQITLKDPDVWTAETSYVCGDAVSQATSLAAGKLAWIDGQTSQDSTVTIYIYLTDPAIRFTATNDAITVVSTGTGAGTHVTTPTVNPKVTDSKANNIAIVNPRVFSPSNYADIFLGHDNQVTFTVPVAGTTRAAYVSGGSDLQVGEKHIAVGQRVYITADGSGPAITGRMDRANTGVYNVTAVGDGTGGNQWVEYDNANGVAETITFDRKEDVGSGQLSITAVDTALETFTVALDKTSLFPIGQTFDVFNSTGNNGLWAVSTSVYNSGLDTTTITVTGNITNAVADGKLESIHEGPFLIVGIDIGLDRVDIEGDKTTLFVADYKFQIKGSTGNDGVYKVTSSSYNAGTGETEILVADDVTDATVNGTVDGISRYEALYVINGNDFLLEFMEDSNVELQFNDASLNIEGSQLPLPHRLNMGNSIRNKVLGNAPTRGYVASSGAAPNGYLAIDDQSLLDPVDTPGVDNEFEWKGFSDLKVDDLTRDYSSSGAGLYTLPPPCRGMRITLFRTREGFYFDIGVSNTLYYKIRNQNDEFGDLSLTPWKVAILSNHGSVTLEVRERLYWDIVETKGTVYTLDLNVTPNSHRKISHRSDTFDRNSDYAFKGYTSARTNNVDFGRTFNMDSSVGNVDITVPPITDWNNTTYPGPEFFVYNRQYTEPFSTTITFAAGNKLYGHPDNILAGTAVIRFVAPETRVRVYIQGENGNHNWGLEVITGVVLVEITHLSNGVNRISRVLKWAEPSSPLYKYHVSASVTLALEDVLYTHIIPHAVAGIALKVPHAHVGSVYKFSNNNRVQTLTVDMLDETASGDRDSGGEFAKLPQVTGNVDGTVGLSALTGGASATIFQTELKPQALLYILADPTPNAAELITLDDLSSQTAGTIEGTFVNDHADADLFLCSRIVDDTTDEAAGTQAVLAVQNNYLELHCNQEGIYTVRNSTGGVTIT